jgi:hypothetical protein
MRLCVYVRMSVCVSVCDRYVYESLPSLLGSLLCLDARYVGRMNAQGVLRMARNLFALQECLSDAAVAPAVLLAHLDRARQLYAVVGSDIEVRGHGMRRRVYV